MTANQVDVALASPVPEVGSQLVALEEDQWFDRKGAQIAAKDLGVPLTAFANAEGGTIVIGLHSGKVQGLKQYQAKINDIRQAPIDFTSPPVRAAFSEIKCLNERGEEDFLLAIRVEPGERVHELKNGDCYLRVGDESRKLTYHQRQELEFDKGQSQYDGFACPGVTVSDLDSGLIDGYKASMGSTGSVERAFHARSLLTRNGEVTNAAYLLFAPYPQDLFPQAYVRVIRFLTTERGTGARLGLEEGADARVEGPIPLVIDEASDLIDKGCVFLTDINISLFRFEPSRHGRVLDFFGFPGVADSD